jgi:hypothetical protein
MRNRVTMIGCEASGCQNGIVFGPGVDAHLVDTRAFNCGNGIVFQGDPVSFREQLGLPPDTTPAELVEVLTGLRDAGKPSPAEAAPVLAKTSLFKRLTKAGYDLVALTANLATIAQHEYLPTIIDRLSQLAA